MNGLPYTSWTRALQITSGRRQSIRGGSTGNQDTLLKTNQMSVMIWAFFNAVSWTECILFLKVGKDSMLEFTVSSLDALGLLNNLSPLCHNHHLDIEAPLYKIPQCLHHFTVAFHAVSFPFINLSQLLLVSFGNKEKSQRWKNSLLVSLLSTPHLSEKEIS